MNRTAFVSEYFGTYLGAAPGDVQAGELRVVASDRRARPEKGWGYTFAVWILLTGDRGVVSVRPDLEAEVTRAIEQLEPGEFRPEAMLSAVSATCSGRMRGSLSVIYVCDQDGLKVRDCGGCRRMTEQDVEAYIALKQSMWAELDADCERNDIRRNIADGIAYGVFQAAQMVSASSAPRVAHMNDRVEEVGVDTHPDYRRRGYGASVVSHMTEAILGLGRTPVYRTGADNVASRRLVESCGYIKFADSVVFRPD
jgi:GNAT superfamily N-acetyltransferase